MDAHEITCPKCGYLNNYISEGCVKCGIIFSKYYEIQERQKEKESPNAGVDGTEGKTQAISAPIFEVNPEPTASESVVVGAEVGGLADTGGIESEVPLKAEVKSQEIPLPPVSEISMHEIEMPATLKDKSAPGELQPGVENDSGKRPAQGELKASEEEVVAPMGADAPPAATEVLMSAEAQEGGPVPPEDAGKQLAEEPVPAETAAPEEVLELTEPAKKEQTGQDRLETQAPETPEPVKEKGADPAGADPVSGPGQEKTEVAVSDKNPPAAQGEEEIVLEEIATPAKVPTVTGKGENRPRADLLKKQRAALARAESLKNEKDAQDKAAALKKQKLAQAKLDALKKQDTAQAKMEALKRQKAELARAEALKKQKVSPVKAEALKRQEEAPTKTDVPIRKTLPVEKETPGIRQQFPAGSAEPKLKTMGLLKKYEGQSIGINYDNSAEIKEAELVEANDEFFTVRVKDQKLHYSYPLQTLLSLIEGEDGVEMGEAEKKSKFSAVIKVYPLVLF